MTIDSDMISIIISIIWGLGVACLFRKICDSNSCVVVKYPLNLDDYFVHKKNKCYNFKTKECFQN